MAEDALVSPKGTGFNSFSLAHNFATEAQVDAVMEQAIETGATLVKKPQKVYWGGYFTDPDGHLWEVAHNPHFWVGPSDDSA